MRATDTVSLWAEDSLQLQHEPLELRTDTPWDKGLEHFEEKTVVLFMALHGGADGQGAYLLPNDATASSDPANRLRVAAVLDRLARLPKEKNKILVLDAAEVTANWSFGMLSNAFARQLRQLAPRIEAIPNLIVLASSDVDQRAWVCQELRRTIYAHYVLEGLRGAAGDRDHDGRISAWELHAFVSGKVQRWVEANRGALQTPILLPEGKEGARRAARIDLVVANKDYQPPDPHQTPVFAPPTELRDVWRLWSELANSTPAPPANTPALRRRFQDTLLRYEQLLRAEDTNSAARLRNRLRGLQYQIERGRSVQLASTQNTLAMPWAAGLSDYRPADATDALNELWNAEPQERSKRFAKLLATRDPQAQRLLRLGISDLLLQRTAEDPLNHLEPCCQLLRLIDDPLRPKPAEAHFALMLQRDLPKQAWTSEGAELVKLALKTRLLAERTALAAQPGQCGDSQRLHAWIAKTVEEADSQRRPGEDLLFADRENWPRAERFLTAAQAGYQRALRIAQQVQEALRMRNETLATLPYYTQWLARRRAQDDGNHASEDLLVKDMESLWRDTHELARRLEHADPRALGTQPEAAAGGQAVSLAEQAQRVWRAFQRTQRCCDRLAQELANSESPSAWRDADDALVVPCGDADVRMKLLANKRRNSRRVFIDTAGRCGEMVPRDPPTATCPRGGERPAARPVGVSGAGRALVRRLSRRESGRFSANAAAARLV